MSRRHPFSWLLLAIVLFVSTPVSADVGVPMIAVAWPLAWMALLPIIAIEAFVARRTFTNDWSLALKVSAAANAVSAAVGVPLAWIGTFAVSLGPAYLADRFLRPNVALVVAAPMYTTWLPPLQKNSVWMIPAALAVLCIPVFFVTVWIERVVARKLAVDAAPELVRRWSWQANGLTYALAVIALITNAIFSYHAAA